MLGLRVSAVVFFLQYRKRQNNQAAGHAGSWGLGSQRQLPKAKRGEIGELSWGGTEMGENLGNWAGEKLKWISGLAWAPSLSQFWRISPHHAPRKGWLNVARLALHHITPHHSSHMCSIRHHHHHHQLHADQSIFRMESSHHYYRPFYQLSSALWADWWLGQKTDKNQSHERKFKKLKIAFLSFYD